VIGLCLEKDGDFDGGGNVGWVAPAPPGAGRRECGLVFRGAEGPQSAAGVRDDALDIFCECGRDECLGKVAVPFKVFFRARRHAGWFIVMAGHHADAIEEVVEAADAYWVVGKQRRW